jgi:hypothetical protein
VRRSSLMCVCPPRAQCGTPYFRGDKWRGLVKREWEEGVLGKGKNLCGRRITYRVGIWTAERHWQCGQRQTDEEGQIWSHRAYKSCLGVPHSSSLEMLRYTTLGITGLSWHFGRIMLAT